MANRFHVKKFSNDHFLEIEPYINRLEKICIQCEKYRPNTYWASDKISRKLIRYSEHLASVDRPVTLKDLFYLCESIDNAHQLGLIHGDIIRRNILLSDTGFHLIDWEPSLKRCHQGKFIMMATYPYIHPQDKRGLNLTKLTDLLCVQEFILAVYEGYRNRRMLLCSMHHQNEEYNLFGITATEILEEILVSHGRLSNYSECLQVV